MKILHSEHNVIIDFTRHIGTTTGIKQKTPVSPLNVLCNTSSTLDVLCTMVTDNGLMVELRKIHIRYYFYHNTASTCTGFLKTGVSAVVSISRDRNQHAKK